MKIRLLIIAALLTGFAAKADDEHQSDLRANPDIENSRQKNSEYSPYSWMSLDRNHIDMNGADWGRVIEKFDSASRGETLMNIVYLGDSHIQADFGGAVVRRRLGETAPLAGRGIIIPFKLAGTNQPVDYTMTATKEVRGSRLLKRPWPTRMPFTGIGVETDDSLSLTITSEMPFNSVRFLWKGVVPEADTILDSAVNTHTMRIDMPQSTLGGAVLTSDSVGVLFHSIGNNGATYADYGGILGFGEGLQQLNPDLIIIALGTNEAFNVWDPEVMEANMEVLLSTIRRHSPQAALLLVTPTECYRKRFRGRGRRRRAAGYTINGNVSEVRDVVRNFAEREGLPLYDTYEVVGGRGAAPKMKSDGILGKDGVHFTAAGYRLTGSIFADALIEALKLERIDDYSVGTGSERGSR